MGVLRVLLVDDHPVVRLGIRSLLNSQTDITVVGEASSGEEALRKARQLKPDLVLMDIAMPGMSGIEATRLIKKELPHVHVLILTMHDDEEFFFPVLRAGASGYVLKESDYQELLYAVRLVPQGQVFLSPAVAKSVLDDFLGASAGQDDDRYGALTPREKEVLGLAAAGQTNREMAATLFLSMRTVEKHRQAVMRKLGLSTREDLKKYALRRGLIDFDL